MSLLPPINLKKWIEDHRDYLKPPVCNKMVFEENGFIVMIVGGPNSRKDFHYDEGPELFYQIEGDMILKIVTGDNRHEDVTIKEGEMYLLPPRTPHSPQRFENTVGLVVERTRTEAEKDGLMWYCDECQHKIYEEYFVLENIEKDLPKIFKKFYASEKARTCGHCNHIMPANNS